MDGWISRHTGRQAGGQAGGRAGSNNVNIPLILIITINWVVLDYIFCNLYTYITITLVVWRTPFTHFRARLRCHRTIVKYQNDE